MLYPHQASSAFAMIGDGPSTGDVLWQGKEGDGASSEAGWMAGMLGVADI